MLLGGGHLCQQRFEFDEADSGVAEGWDKGSPPTFCMQFAHQISENYFSMAIFFTQNSLPLKLMKLDFKLIAYSNVPKIIDNLDFIFVENSKKIKISLLNSRKKNGIKIL